MKVIHIEYFKMKKQKVQNFLEKLLSLPKSIYVCLHFFSLNEAIKLPILVRYNCKLLSLAGKVNIKKCSGGGKTSDA